jgi:nucleoside-diphosphate-sugar epimerase
MKHIAITGATGFIGKNLTRYLGTDLYKLTPIRYREETPLTLFNGSNAIIHLGGKAHEIKKKSIEDVYLHANFELTKKLYSYFLSSEAKTFIFLSSVKAVADTAESLIREDSLASSLSIYGKSKRMAEDFILNQNTPDNKRVIILRPCMIHGPGNKGNLNLLYRVAKLGIPYPLASFENNRSFLSVENLCFVIKELIERTDIPSGIYHIADDIPLSTNQIVEIISETVSKTARLWKVPRPLIKVIAKIGDYLPLPINSERLQKLTENYVVSNAKLLAALNKPLPVSSEEGLRKTIQSFLSDQ